MPILTSLTSNFNTSKSISSPRVLNPSLAAVLTNPNAYGTTNADSFSSSISVYGSRVAVGAPNEDDSTGSSSGKAYVFNGLTGSLLYTLDNPVPQTTAYFGGAISISSNYLVVGAQQANDANNRLSSGRAYIYYANNGNYIGAIYNPNVFYANSGADRFGISLQITDTHAIIGAYGEDSVLTGDDTGKAYIFSIPSGQLLHVLDNPNAYGNTYQDYFGYKVAISNNYAIVVARFEDEIDGTNSGKAYVYSVNTGTLLYTLNNPNIDGIANGDLFGFDVSITDTHVLVSAANELNTVGAGKAYIFNVANGALMHVLENPNIDGDTTGDSFGYAVAINGLYAVIGAYGEDDAVGVNQGKVYIYSLSNGALLQVLNNPNYSSGAANDWFGYAVALSDTHIAVGALREDLNLNDNSGIAYVYSLFE